MSTTDETEDLKKYPEPCKKCSGDKIYFLSLTVVKCYNCLKSFNLSTAPSGTNDSTLSIKQNENNTEKKIYSFRKIKRDLKSEFKAEPEIIELLSSDDDSDGTSASREDDLNNDASNDKNGDSNSKNGTPQTNGNSAKYVFKEWEIKETDTESLETILNGKLSTNSKIIPTTKEIAKRFSLNSDIFEKSVKNFRLGSFASASDSTFEISSEGLNFKLKIREDEEEDLLVSITICMQDIVYCAIVFHNPVYALLIRIHDTTSNLYYNQLKELKSFQTSHIDRNNKSRITALLDISKSEEAETSRQLYSFFKRLPVSSEIPFRSNFIKLNKSKQLVYSVFRDDKSLVDVACFTKECLANDLAKPILKYPSGDDSVEISNLDLSCLDNGVFLNDNIISFYLKYLQYEVLTEQDRKRTHIFDTFFYQCLTTKSQKRTKDEINLSAAERRHSRVKNWTRNVDLFKKDFLIFPINKNAHWYLVIICYPYLSEPIYEDKPYNMESMDTDDEKKQDTDFNLATDLKKSNRTEKNSTDTIGLFESDQSADEADEDDSNFSTMFSNNKENNKICTKMPIVLIFDSLLSRKKTRVIATLRQYLQCEWKAKFGTEEKKPLCLDKLAGTTVKVPIQTNYYDCGIYLLQYVEQFFKDPITDFILPISLDKWFTTEIINKKREYIKNIILKKSKEKPAKIETKEFDKINPTIQSDEENAKKDGSLKKPNGINKEVKESTNNTIKKLKLTESHNDAPKSPIRSTFILRKDQDKSKSKHILDDMDNLI